MKNRTTQRNKIKDAINVSQGTSYLRIASKLENKLINDYRHQKTIGRISQEQNISVMFLNKYFNGLIERGIIEKRRLFGNNRKIIVAAYKKNPELNQSELARNLGVSRQLVAKYIKGEISND
jgi:predicted transcriptional regulator